MTSLTYSEAHTISNSICFSLGIWESSEDSENYQHFYPGFLFFFFCFKLFFAITSLGKMERTAEVKLFYNEFLCAIFFSAVTS